MLESISTLRQFVASEVIPLLPKEIKDNLLSLLSSSQHFRMSLKAQRPYPPAMETVIDLVTQRLCDGLHPSRIYLFGSYARRHYGPDSDLDFLVVVPSSGEPRHRRAEEAYRLLQGIEAPKDVLVLSEEEWNRERRSGVSLSNVVEQEGILLYEA